MVQFSLRRRFQRRVLVLRRCIRRLLDRVFMSCLGKTVRYRMLPHAIMMTPASPSSPPSSSSASPSIANESSSSSSKDVINVAPAPTSASINNEVDSDLVSLKITLLGDAHTGKTSFMVKYVGGEEEQGRVEGKGLSSIGKTLLVKGARISYSIWEVEGDEKSKDHIPVACKDSVAVLFMFDLTSRCTLNSVIRWYQEARKWNQTAIPIIVGTKFDDFIQLPIDLQWTIASEARTLARALNATLFFSSATYNINVNKIFKFITARLFDLPWTVERNLTLGEPIIDF
ncbi:septum-promoting GTP-binding protein 1 [Ziziphus jujuba]|uniref:Septum-promoting GTP-binding protein 1 n=1 Tax=Ziziphus jujuba TaxID=326968 RepID=A0ABM3IHG9_ZIZJJ|nr:septum-promoting GTP-binding protein 1 [Ziziphus jujuba]